MTKRLKKGYLQWRCRRGTKELDMVLTDFLNDNYNELSDKEITDFDELLDAQDTVLWNWLIEKEQPETKNLQAILAKIDAFN